MDTNQLRPGCPGEEAWFQAGQHRMRYFRMGPVEGAQSQYSPLVLIHGLMGYSFSWRHNVAELARKRTVYAIDLLGIGYSDRPPADTVDYSLRATAIRILDWLVWLGLKEVDLLGTSHGGAVAMMAAAINRGRATTPALIKRLLLVAPANPWANSAEIRIAFFNTKLGNWMLRKSLPWVRAARSISLGRMYGDPTKITQETREGYGRMMDLPGTADYALAILKTWNEDMLQLKYALPAVADIPALLLWGTLDRVVPPVSGYRLAAVLKNSELKMMEGIGHLPYEEDPEEFNRIVLEFLDRLQRTAS